MLRPTIAQLWEAALIHHAASDRCLRLANESENKLERSRLLLEAGEWADEADALALQARLAEAVSNPFGWQTAALDLA
jgi:hypothetical protein